MDANLQSYSLVLHQDADPTTGGVAICGFTTAGMVGVISTSHIIKTLGLKQLGTVMHKDFPAVALIHDEVPKHPVRVYQGNGLGVFTSEIQFGNETDIMFASTVLEWFTKGGFDRLIIIDGLTRPEKELSNGELFGVGSIPAARERLKQLDIEPIQQGIVAVTALLASVGAAGIPHAGTVMMVIVMQAVGLPTDAVLVILAVDRVLDMGRTTVNVWSDSVGAAIIASFEDTSEEVPPAEAL